MELSEEMRYRLCYLTLRLALDQKLERDWAKGECAGTLEFLDLMSGTHLSDAKPDEDHQYVSQRAKLEDFLDAEYGEEVLAVVLRAINEIV